MGKTSTENPSMEIINGETCPLCHKKTLNLYEGEQDVPNLGKLFIFGMQCTDKECDFKQHDVELENAKEPCRIEFTVSNKKDLSARVIKSSQATVKVPQLKMSVEPGVTGEGYISNIEGVLQRFKKILEAERDTADEDSARKKAKNLLKKLWKAECGDEELKIIIEDPSGNSAILSENVIVSSLKAKKK